MSRHHIKENDIVTVNFNGSQLTLCHRAKVLNVPCQTGDSWIFEDTDNGAVHYVSEGCTITLTEGTCAKTTTPGDLNLCERGRNIRDEIEFAITASPDCEQLTATEAES